MRHLKKYIDRVSMDSIKRYFWRNLIAIDQLANTILGGNEDETISSRCGKKVRDHGRKYKIAYYLCRLIHPLDKDHCIEAIENEDE